MTRLIDADALKDKRHFTKEQALKIALNTNVPFSSHDTQHVFNTAQIEEMLNLAATAAITNAPTVQREGWVSVPQTVLMTIARLLDNEMNQCAESGANSVSMPDDLVELAVWLSAAPTDTE